MVAGPKPSHPPRLVAGFLRAAGIASLLPVAIGALVCAGWLLGVPALARLHPALAAMKLNAALSLILLGAAARLAITRRAPRAVRVLAGITAVLAAATLAEHVLGIDLGIDHLVRDPTGDAGRMSPATALSLLLVALALLDLAAWWAEALAVLILLCAHGAVLGYLYGAHDLYTIGPDAAIALPAAVAIYSLALAIVVGDHRPRGAMSLVTHDSPGGLLARRTLPAAMIVPAGLALIAQGGERAGLYSAGLGRVLLVAGNTIAFVALICWTAAELIYSDELRRAADEAVRDSEEHKEASLVSAVRSTDRLRALAAVSDAFAAVATTYQPLLHQIARTVADLVGDGCLVTLISVEDDRLYNAASAHRNPALAADYKAYLAGTEVLRTDPESVSARVVRSGRPVRADIKPAEMVAQSAESLRPVVARLNVHGFAVVPIRARQTVIGTLSVLRNAAGHSYSAEDVTLLQDLADRAGLAIENARLYARLEQRVQERTAELEAANQELEAFSSSVAHDLRAPLRAISGFSQALIEDASDRLGPEDARHATQIRDAAHRMSELIDDLLDLARISRTEPRRRKVEVSELAKSVAAGLATAHPERSVEVVIADGLVASADPRLLEVVLTNLLGNAWKFTSKRAGARIELGVHPVDRPAVYFVRDNGAGFDPQQAGKLFGVFQRLHAADEFEGTGIGLATVQRIIHRHGGQIWAEAEPDRGATFYFTLEPPPTGRVASPRSPS